VRWLCIFALLCGCIETWSDKVYVHQSNAFALEALGDYEGAWRERRKAQRYQRKLARAEIGVPEEQYPR
jgi:hypothetical protein